MGISGESTFQAAGTADAKALKQEWAGVFKKGHGDQCGQS